MDELTIGDKVYISSKRAAKITGYAKDYVGQLCREGRVEARLVGRNWYVLESSITEHRFGSVQEEKQDVLKPIEAKNKAYQWSAPTYEAETPVPVPSLIPREPEVLASRKVVSEMQAAWQEWFSQQPVVQAQPEEVPVESLEASQEPETDEEVVSFVAVRTDETLSPEPEATYTVAPAVSEYSYSAMTEVMDLSRKHEPEDLVSEEDSEEYPDQPEYPAEVTTRPSSALRIVLIGVALIAGSAALVGTGVVGDVLLQSYGSDSQLGSTIKYLGGESVYVNSSK
jgi:hypothetical protein